MVIPVFDGWVCVIVVHIVGGSVAMLVYAQSGHFEFLSSCVGPSPKPFGDCNCDEEEALFVKLCEGTGGGGGHV